MKNWISFTGVGTGHSWIVLIWSSSIQIPSRVTTNPRYLIVLVLKVYLLNLAYSPKVQSLSMTSQICFLCSSLVSEYCYEPTKHGTTGAYQMQATGARQVSTGRTGVPRSRVQC
jgi:hypothetical protein